MVNYRMFFRRKHAVSAGAAALAGLVVLAASSVIAAPRPDEPDRATPFLRAPARTVAALVHEVRNDPAARARYAAFFQIPPDETIAYLKSRLTPGVIPATAPYTVYFLSRKGMVYPVWLTLPAGARVFYGEHRTPVILCNSGDPVTPPLWAIPPAKPHKAAKQSETASALPVR